LAAAAGRGTAAVGVVKSTAAEATKAAKTAEGAAAESATAGTGLRVKFTYGS
jgi:hypothetical protein